MAILKYIKIKDVLNGYDDRLTSVKTALNGTIKIANANIEVPRYSDNNDACALIRNINYSVSVFIPNVYSDRNNGDVLVTGQEVITALYDYTNDKIMCDNFKFSDLTMKKRSEFLDKQIAIMYNVNTSRKEYLKIESMSNNYHPTGKRVYKQYIRNRLFYGTWVDDAIKRFATNQCDASKLAGRYINGKAKDFDYLETALDWVSLGRIESYMCAYQESENADELWNEFSKIVHWINRNFPTFNYAMCYVDWGLIYNQYGHQDYDTNKLALELAKQFEMDINDDYDVSSTDQYANALFYCSGGTDETEPDYDDDCEDCGLYDDYMQIKDNY